MDYNDVHDPVYAYDGSDDDETPALKPIPTRHLSHGHVFPRKDNGRMRCGGPRICKVCKNEYAEAVKAGYSVAHVDRFKR